MAYETIPILIPDSPIQQARLEMQEAAGRLATGESFAEELAEYDEEDLRDAARSFACVMAPIPEPYAARVQALAARIPDAALAANGRETAPHCTVRWGLDDADRAAVRAAIAAWPGPARLRLGATSAWPTPDGDCVKIDVDSPDLADLRRLIEGAAPAAADTHPFEAHITLAYVAPGRGGDFAGWADLEGLDIAVDALEFSAQDDSTTPLPLGGPVALIGAWDPNQPRDEAGKWTDGVSDAEWQSWADFGHSAINDVLTGKDIVGTIDDNGGEKITKKSAAEYAQTARRIDAAAASQVAVNPGESNEFFRGEIHENLAALKKAYPHNKEITIDRLVSTSGDYQHAQGYADQGHEMSPDALKVVVRFYNKNGVRGARARYFGEPSPEVVLARGQKFRVRGIRKHPQTGVHEVVLQSKESHPADLPRVTITTKASRIRAAAFDPNQPRDEAGKWTDGSSSSLPEAARLNGKDYIDNRKVIAVSEEILRGDAVDTDTGLAAGASPHHVAAARALVNAVRSAPEAAMPLFRGLGFDQAPDALEALRPGDSVTMGRLSSFSEDRGYASLYADKNSGAMKYEIRLEGAHRSLATDAHTGQAHRERLTFGKFEVLRIEDGGAKVPWPANFGNNYVRYKRTIVLKQVGVF